MTKTAPISTAKMQYWRNIARELITQRGHSRLIDGGHMAVGSVFMSGIRQHIEADIETCGRDYRVFIYEETTLAHTSRIQNVGTGWYFRDTKTTIVLPNGVKANLGRLRFNTPQEVVFWLCNQFYQFTADVQPRVVVGELA